MLVRVLQKADAKTGLDVEEIYDKCLPASKKRVKELEETGRVSDHDTDMTLCRKEPRL